MSVEGLPNPEVRAMTVEDSESDRMQHDCGVFMMYAPNPDTDVAMATYYGLMAEQHRGQEAAGMAVGNGQRLMVFKDQGLVSTVFAEGKVMAGFPQDSYLTLGHVRWGTHSNLKNPYDAAGPMFEKVDRHRDIALAMNGDVVNERALLRKYKNDIPPDSIASDMDLLAKALAVELRKTDGMAEALSNLLERTVGGYAFVITDGIKCYAGRDPNGIRPLVIGELPDGGYVTASETSALDTVNATYLRDVRPGELVTFDESGMHSLQLLEPGPEAKCSFERAYFARADSRSDGESYYAARRRDGVMLREGDDVEADMVIGMPDSGTPAAIGYAAAAGIPYEAAVVKNNYVGRTYIKPQGGRGGALKIKINFAPDFIKGKRIIVVDDSAVEGNTMIARIEELYALGAAEVHVRIASPPIVGGCKFGVSFDEPKLLARGRTEAEIADYTKATSWKYLRLAKFKESIGMAAARTCFGCMDGNYPLDLVGALASEEKLRAAAVPAGNLALAGATV